MVLEMIYCLTWYMKYSIHGIWNDMLPRRKIQESILSCTEMIWRTAGENRIVLSQTQIIHFCPSYTVKHKILFLIGPDNNDRWHVSLPILMTNIIGRGGVNSFFTLKGHFTYNSSSKLARQCVSVLQLWVLSNVTIKYKKNV